jgi:nicotinamidase/pyrazinamidase
MEKKAALLIVDLQNDFCPGGALQVPAGDRVIAPINRALERFVAAGLPVFASRDWHPPTTRHFSQYGGPWPVHCVQGTPGAAFHRDLHLPATALVLSKGLDPEMDGYSAFEGVSEDGRSLQAIMAELGVQHLYLAGLATDYCVLSTAREALRSGLTVTILTDAVAGVDVAPGDSDRALTELGSAGARLATVDELQVGGDVTGGGGSMRLFIAIELPGEVKRMLAGLRTEIPGARWVPPEQLHLTLAFLGEVEAASCALLTEKLAAIAAPSFELRFSGTGCFPSSRQPRVLWAGLAEQPRLTNLAELVRTAVLACGILQEERPFSPHITLARFRQPAGREVGAFLEKHQRLALPVIDVREFILFQSRLTPRGAIHRPFGQFPLAAG